MTTAQQQKAANAAELHTLYVRNILSVYYAANPVTIQYGAAWYRMANDIAQQFASAYDVPFYTVVGVISATSPQNEWNRNVAMTEKILANFKAGISAVEGRGYLTAGLKKCDDVLALPNPAADDVATVLNGQKITNFFRAICGDGSAVCVDGHASNIALHGLRRVGITQAKALTPLQYTAVADAYRAAAEVLGITGTACQAVTWVTYKELTAAK